MRGGTISVRIGGVGDDLYRVGDEHVFAVVAERIR